MPPWRAPSVNLLRARAESRNSACRDVQGHPVISLILQLWIKLLPNPALNVLECFLAETHLNWEARESVQLATHKAAAYLWNSCLTLGPRSRGALAPNPGATRCAWGLWSEAMNVCLLLMVLPFHVELASVTQMFVFTSERRKRRKTHFFLKARVSMPLFSSCLACYQTVLAVVFRVSSWDLLQPVCNPRRFQTYVAHQHVSFINHLVNGSRRCGSNNNV